MAKNPNKRKFLYTGDGIPIGAVPGLIIGASIDAQQMKKDL